MGEVLPIALLVFQILLDIAVQSASFQLIAFGKDDGEGDSMFAQPSHEFDVDDLWIEP